uniref:rhomboid protease n=1 Tax=Attheya septentrionalis TaxID=420275 RepID=A0A7S2XSY5_9STRA|mmetsp:Transcript_5824/g.10323  ORF Transcript_5824/g.10323 Transcript_5824/m.10323 type:complete len:336 (+) Transcript_5824:84-1091(+)
MGGFRKKDPQYEKGDNSEEHDYHEHVDEFNDEENSERNKVSKSKYEDDPDYDGEDEINVMDHYRFRQRFGIASIVLSAGQTIVMAAMMWQCGIAPININPMLGPYPDALSYWGAKNSVLILDDGEIWRLVTPIFLHAGVLHLVGNIGVQMETGVFFEREWGSLKFLIIYFGSGISSSILSVCAKPDILSVGSSGAVMGLFGAKLSEILLKYWRSQDTIQDRVSHAVRQDQLGGVLCGVLIVGLMSFIPFVDWAAHLGGLIGGIAIGMLVFAPDTGAKTTGCFWLLVGAGCTAGLFISLLVYMYTEVEPQEDLRDVCQYYKQMTGDDGYECTCSGQ